MKNKLPITLVISTLMIFGLCTKVSQARIFDTINISRTTPPPVPTTPTKPEPPTPPTKPEPPNVPTSTPRVTPTPSSSPIPTTTPTSSSNGDGGTGGSSSSSSSSSGEVLGAMATTGVAEETLFNMIFSLGSLLTAFGIKKSFKITEK